ncbi:MAG TPA: lipase maturation factor family protein, partial [Bryobacteraceae bacterium]|nr:lipase maturation factor family protein [Bryobacteraceae bacterium]
MMPDSTLIFDGDCSFCRTWVEYWKSLTGDRVSYLSIEASRQKFPDLDVEQMRRRVHLVTPQGVYQGAEAVCRSLAGVPGYGWLLWMYRYVPLFAEIAELFYRITAKHRGTAMTVTRALWGDQVVRSEYTTAGVMFGRALSFVYLVALASIGMQVRGLIGSEGVLPVDMFFKAAQSQLGVNAPWRLPSLFWWANTDFALLSIAWGGVTMAAVSLIAKPWGHMQRTIFAILFLYYLSFVSAGQVFMGFQWDYLLLETGFLAIFLRPERSRVWLFQWLLFRLMFESGAVKLLSHDPSWRNLTALDV